jgi:hypothetical protein
METLNFGSESTFFSIVPKGAASQVVGCAERRRAFVCEAFAPTNALLEQSFPEFVASTIKPRCDFASDLQRNTDPMTWDRHDNCDGYAAEPDNKKTLPAPAGFSSNSSRDRGDLGR